MKSPKQVILDALQRYKGDDLERAEFAFKNLPDDKLDKEYGQSGQTCREILEGYRQQRAEVENAFLWLNSLQQNIDLGDKHENIHSALADRRSRNSER